MSPTLHKKRVAVLRGGPSSEYEVSMKSGSGVIAALREAGFEVKDVIISRKGEWLLHGFVKQPEQALIDVDAVFIALHGAYGEDGTVQRALERLAVPYTGSRSYPSAIAMNKLLTKEHLKKHDVPIQMPPHIKLARKSIADLSRTSANIAELFGPEYVIKPLCGGSSIGTTLARRENLHDALLAALRAHEEVLVEKRIAGIEATVGVLEWFRGEALYVLPPIEIVPPPSASFFSVDAKYSGESDEICPGRFSKLQKQELLSHAKAVHRSLGLRQYSRSDFIVAPDGIYFLEVNTLPGLTPQSLFPKSMEAVGSNYRELVTHLLATV